MDKKTLAKTVVLFRARNNLTQKELGELCGLTKRTIGAVERQEWNLSPRACAKLCDVIFTNYLGHKQFKLNTHQPKNNEEDKKGG